MQTQSNVYAGDAEQRQWFAAQLQQKEQMGDLPLGITVHIVGTYNEKRRTFGLGVLYQSQPNNPVYCLLNVKTVSWPHNMNSAELEGEWGVLCYSLLFNVNHASDQFSSLFFI